MVKTIPKGHALFTTVVDIGGFQRQMLNQHTSRDVAPMRHVKLRINIKVPSISHICNLVCM